ncbi:MAG: hypothetical protein KA144_02640 [Xanthomonadaceae bacterium]|nr:hypothetical protein [Xanthomonadaceae bacterium]
MSEELRTLADVGRALVAIALIVAAIAKGRDLRGFARDLERSFSRLRGGAAMTLASAIVLAEAIIAIVMIFGGEMSRAASLAAFALMTIFTLVVAWSVLFDRGLVCSCFGAASGHRMNGYDLTRNLLLTAAAAAAWRGASEGDALAAFATRPIGVSVALVVCGLIAFLFVASLQDIILLLRIRSER